MMHGQQRVTVRDKDNNDEVLAITNQAAHTILHNSSGEQIVTIEQALTTADLFHTKVHDGTLFAVDHIAIGVGANVITNYVIEVGKASSDCIDAGLHLRLEVNVEGGVRIDVYPNPTYTGGTTFEPRNFNGNCDYTINPTGPLVKRPISVCKSSPTITATGPVWKTYMIGGTGTNQAKTSADAQTVELILPPSSNVLIRYTTIASNNSFEGTIVFYEDEIQVRT